MKSFKPWLSFSDQLQRLRDRGLVVENKAAALDYLERIGYYRLSGYWYPLRQMDKAASNTLGKPVRADTFEPGSRFEDVVRLYVFDKKTPPAGLGCAGAHRNGCSGGCGSSIG